MYEKLFDIFRSYKEDDWLQIIADILNDKSLNLPISINSGYAEEALIFINEFLSKRDKCTLLKYQKYLIDFYTTLEINNSNSNKFKTLHWVISAIKPIQFRYSLENKFTREYFLQTREVEIGEYLQINLLSCLSSLSYVERESITSYLFNRMKLYNSNSFILISLRYILKTAGDEIYFDYLNKIIMEKLNSNNVSEYVESLKEYVYQKKSYQSLYLWYELNQDKYLNSNEEQFRHLQNELRKWINYKNNQIHDDAFCELLLFELNKERLLPPETLRNLVNYINRIPLIKEKLRKYFDYSYKKFAIYTPYLSTIPYRFINQKIILDASKIGAELTKQLISEYKLNDEDSFNMVDANKEQIDILRYLNTSAQRN